MIRSMLLALAIAGLFFLPDPWRVVFVVVAAFVEVGEVYLWIRFLRRYRITTGVEGMIGERAEVIEACAPQGRVRLRGEIWTARCELPVRPGEVVRVSRVDGLVLVVAPERR
jgi:membrane protein implicated in regulation of membrane protease activity